MGKGNDPNCSTGAVAEAVAMVAEVPEAAPEASSGRPKRLTLSPERGLELALIYGKPGRMAKMEWEVTHRQRNPDRRRVTSSHTAMQRDVDDFGLLGEMELPITLVSQYHPDPETRTRACKVLVQCNQRLAMKMARDWQHAWGHSGFTEQEFFDEAREGLWRAAELFENDKDARFFTFAKIHVRMRLNRYVENNSERIYGVRLPTERFWEIHAVNRTIAQLEKRMPGDVTSEAVVAVRHEEEIKKLLGKGMEDLTDEQLKAKLDWAMDMRSKRGRSLNETLRTDDPEGVSEFGHRLADEGPGTAELAEQSVMLDQMRQIMTEALDEEERLYIGSIDLAGHMDEYTPAENNAEMAARLSVKESRVRLRRREGKKKLADAMVAAGLVPEL
jgi:DNA-directed RNA polymerase sigma subunit (sigma70/sigma32)